MKLLHLSDLHLGKRVNEFPMIEDQRYILTKVVNIVDKEKPDAILIAGDVYDKSVPNEEAVKLLDEFLTKLASRKIPVYIISGNHDSAVKLSFLSGPIEESGIFFAPAYDGKVKPYELKEGNLTVNIWMLPFVKPVNVRAVFPDEAADIVDYTTACRVAVDHMNIDKNACNILVAHQFVTGAERSESEEISVGGLDNVDASVFDAFDYVALGHIHGPQKIGRDTMRYCGTPLKYSFSEVNHKKSVTIVEINENKEINLSFSELEPLHDLREIKGSYEELTKKSNYENTRTDDYMHIILTDEDDVPNALYNLRVVYPNLMKLSYDNKRTRGEQAEVGAADVDNKSPLELFAEFYETMNNQPMSEVQTEFMSKLISSVWGEE